MKYSKYSGRGNFFSLPNEVFLLGMSAGELAVYSFLKRCENRKTHQCWPSIKTIGQAVGMSENTVRKYLRRLEERELITTEPTEVVTKTGEKRNGNLAGAGKPRVTACGPLCGLLEAGEASVYPQAGEHRISAVWREFDKRGYRRISPAPKGELGG